MGMTAPGAARVQSLSTVRIVSVHGHDLRVAVRPGTGEATPLLLCCGIGASFEVLQPFVDALDPAIEVVRFDVPGVGGSPGASFPYGFPGLAWLAAQLTRQLGYARIDVLGISWGGALAQQLAFQHARLVRRLVLVSTGTGSLMVPGHPRVLARMLTPRRYEDPAYAASVIGELYGGSARTNPAPVLALFGDGMRRASWRGYGNQLLAGFGWTSLPLLPFVRQPTLILAGDDDPVVPLVNARILRRLLPHARLHVYRGGHVGLVTEAQTLTPVVAAFLLGGAGAPVNTRLRPGAGVRS
jgi:poly(3-hydroxyalkanoate) depolymerase